MSMMCFILALSSDDFFCLFCGDVLGRKGFHLFSDQRQENVAVGRAHTLAHGAFSFHPIKLSTPDVAGQNTKPELPIKSYTAFDADTSESSPEKI